MQANLVVRGIRRRGLHFHHSRDSCPRNASVDTLCYLPPLAKVAAGVCYTLGMSTSRTIIAGCPCQGAWSWRKPTSART